MSKLGRPRKRERLAHVSVNLDPGIYQEIEEQARVDGDRPVSAFCRLLLTAAWRTYREKGSNGDDWLRRWGAAEAATANRGARAS